MSDDTKTPRRVETLGLASVLCLAAWLRSWHVGLNGYGNDYYAAAVRSMLESLHNFFFVSFDPAGWVTVDKPPLALWIQALSAKAFGYGKLSLLLPQAAEGVAGVAVLHALVRRSFGPAAALAAALVLTLTPISVAVDRYNNVDACLVLVLLLAAYALGRATEGGSRVWLLAAAALMGLGFNTKMLAAFTALPAMVLVYALAAPGSWRRRGADLALAGCVLAAVSLIWVVAVDLTPPDRRPYVGSTQDNSMLGLTLGWNGLQRFSGRRGPEPAEAAPAPPTVAASAAMDGSGADTARHGRKRHRNGAWSHRRGFPASAAAPAPDPAAAAGQAFAARRRAGGFGRGGMGAGEPGPTRLAQPFLAGQILWFLPLIVLGAAAAVARGMPSAATGADAPDRGGAPGFAPWTWPGRAHAALVGRPDRQALLLWTGWLLSCGAVLSALRSMHPYYLVLLAPPTAALCGIGLRSLWLSHREGRRELLPVALLITALWQLPILLQAPDWGALLPLLSGGAAAAALILALAPDPAPRGGPGWPRIGMAVGLAALLACPVGWALTPVLSPTGDSAVQADPALITGAAADGIGGGRTQRRASGPDRKLLAFLERHRGGARYLVAAVNSQAVGPLIIASGEPAIAVGGFMGGDPIVSAEGFARMVQDGQVRYFLLNAPRPGPAGFPGFGGRRGGGLWGRGGASQALEDWVRAHGRPVDPTFWRSPQPVPLYQPAGPGGFFGGRGGASQLYDLAVGSR